MTDCGCEKALAELEEFLHNELNQEDYADIKEHMMNCGDCEGEARVGIVLTQAVQRACKESMPQELRIRVLTRIREIQSTH
ncbi:MAG TPA: zf-HC2 domain-containing protein [Terrimesophilobacter sp.]|nr:zf-HC2 domain-containing protein [Terrimesophilobacter sp.]